MGLLMKTTRSNVVRVNGRSRTVYVCICNAIRESELRNAARRCGGDAEACYALLGKRPNCGSCLDEAEDMIFEEREMGFSNRAAA